MVVVSSVHYDELCVSTIWILESGLPPVVRVADDGADTTRWDRIAWETVARTIERASRRHELARMEFFNQNSSSLRQLDTAPG